MRAGLGGLGMHVEVGGRHGCHWVASGVVSSSSSYDNLYVYSSVLAFLVIFHIVFSYADYSSCPVGTRAEREAGDVQWMGIGE